MSDDIAEAYSLLGRGFSTAARDGLDDYRKMMKEQQRYALRQQLLSAALTPIATGLSKGVTNFIAEPFREAARDYYNRGPGRSLQVDLATRANANKQAKDLYHTTEKNGGLSHVEDQNLIDAVKQLDNWAFINLGPDFKDTPTYLSQRRKLPESVKEQSKLDYKQIVDFYAATQKTSTGTPTETAELIRKYNPKTMNFGQYVWRGFKNFINKETSEEAQARRETEFRDALEITQEQMDSLKQVSGDALKLGFSREEFSKLPFLNDPEVQEALEKYKKSLKFVARTMETSGSLQRSMNAYIKTLPKGQNPTPEGFSDFLDETFYKEIDSNFGTEKNAFVATYKTDANRRKIITEFQDDKNLTPTQTEALIGKLSGSSFDLARQWVISDFAGTQQLLDRPLSERQEFIRNEITKRSHYIMNNHLEVVEDLTTNWVGWTSEVDERLAINKNKMIEGYRKLQNAPPLPGSKESARTQAQVNLNNENKQSVSLEYDKVLKKAELSDDPVEALDIGEQELIADIQQGTGVTGIDIVLVPTPEQQRRANLIRGDRRTILRGEIEMMRRGRETAREEEEARKIQQVDKYLADVKRFEESKRKRREDDPVLSFFENIFDGETSKKEELKSTISSMKVKSQASKEKREEQREASVSKFLSRVQEDDSESNQKNAFVDFISDIFTVDSDKKEKLQNQIEDMTVKTLEARNVPDTPMSIPASLLRKPETKVDSSISPEEMAEIDSVAEAEQTRLTGLIPRMAGRLVESNSFLTSNRSIEENLDFELEEMFKNNPDLDSFQREAFASAVALAKRILKQRLRS